MASRNGDYAVEVSLRNCIDTSNCISIKLASEEPISLGNQILVFPNPNNGVVNIDFGNLSNCTVVVYDLNGKSLVEYPQKGSSELQFNLEVSKGIYLIEVNSGNTKYSFRLVRRWFLGEGVMQFVIFAELAKKHYWS